MSARLCCNTDYRSSRRFVTQCDPISDRPRALLIHEMRAVSETKRITFLTDADTEIRPLHYIMLSDTAPLTTNIIFPLP